MPDKNHAGSYPLALDNLPSFITNQGSHSQKSA